MKETTSREHSRRLRAILAEIRDEPQRKYTLQSLAKKAFMSPFHFHRVFRQMTGRRLNEHIRHLRLHLAAEQLRLTQQPVTRIALDAGYENHESFSRAFVKTYGQPPRAYRAARKPRTAASKSAANVPDYRVHIVKIPVTNFKRATAYYRDVLGLEEEFAVDAYGWAQYRTGPVPLCLYVTGQGGGDATPGAETGIHLQVRDLKALYKTLRTRGALLHSAIIGSSDGGQFFIVADPDGNRMKIVQGER